MASGYDPNEEPLAAGDYGMADVAAAAGGVARDGEEAIEPSAASGVAVGLVGVLAAVGLVVSAARLATGDFQSTADLGIAIGGVVLGVTALLAAGHLLHRIERLPRQLAELEFEFNFFLYDLNSMKPRGPISPKLEKQATSLYVRLVAANMVDEASVLLETMMALRRCNCSGLGGLGACPVAIGGEQA